MFKFTSHLHWFGFLLVYFFRYLFNYFRYVNVAEIVVIGSAPSSPLITTLQQSQQSVSPIPPQRVANTPPPPPPPLKENQPHVDVKERSLKYDRILSRSTSSPRDKAKIEYNAEPSRSKSVDYRNDETPLKMSFKASEARFNLERSAGKKQEKLNFDNQLVFPELPDLQRYTVDYATNISDFTQTFFGTSFDRQVGRPI